MNDMIFHNPGVWVVFKKLTYWYRKSGEGFYKFLQPCCNHPHYRDGDSWCEELSLSEKTFRKYLSHVCKVHENRWAFVNAEDRFEGMPFACFYDRVQRKTFYYGNDALIQHTLDAYEARTKKITPRFRVTSESIDKDNNLTKINNNPPKSPLRRVEKKGEVGSLTKGLGKKAESPSDPLPETAVQMHTIWTEETAGKIETPRLSLKFAETLLRALQTYFQNSIEKWRMYCRIVASSKFLMGEIGTFKAWLVWVIRGETIQKVREGGYCVTVPSDPQETPMIDASNPIGDHHETLTKDQPSLRADLIAFARRVGLAFYHCWLADAEVRAEGKTLKFSGLLAFSKERIRAHLEMHHPEWEKRVCLG